MPWAGGTAACNPCVANPLRMPCSWCIPLPGWTLVTPGPTLSTMPAASCPRMHGNSPAKAEARLGQQQGWWQSTVGNKADFPQLQVQCWMCRTSRPAVGMSSHLRGPGHQAYKHPVRGNPQHGGLSACTMLGGPFIPAGMACSRHDPAMGPCISTTYIWHHQGCHA